MKVKCSFWQMHDGSSEDFGWSEIPWSSTESEYSTRFRLQPPDIHRRHFGKLIKVNALGRGLCTRFIAAIIKDVYSFPLNELNTGILAIKAQQVTSY